MLPRLMVVGFEIATLAFAGAGLGGAGACEGVAGEALAAFAGAEFGFCLGLLFLPFFDLVGVVEPPAAPASVFSADSLRALLQVGHNL